MLFDQLGQKYLAGWVYEMVSLIVWGHIAYALYINVKDATYVLPLVSDERPVAQEVLQREGVHIGPRTGTVPGHL